MAGQERDPSTDSFPWSDCDIAWALADPGAIGSCMSFFELINHGPLGARNSSNKGGRIFYLIWSCTFCARGGDPDFFRGCRAPGLH